MNAPRSPHPRPAWRGSRPRRRREEGREAGAAGGGAGRGALQTPSRARGWGLLRTRLPGRMPAAAPGRRGRGRGGGMRRDRAGRLRGGRRCLPRRSDRRRRGHRLTEHRLARSGGRAAGGVAPATVTGTNKEVVCARAAPPPRPAPAARGHAPARAPPPRPSSDAGAAGPPPALTPAGSLRQRWARSGTQKKLCAFFFSPAWVPEARRRVASCRGGRGAASAERGASRLPGLQLPAGRAPDRIPSAGLSPPLQG